MQAQLPPLVLKTPPFSHYGLAWSPFHNQRIALSSAANYGLVGNGRLHLASVAGGQIVLDKTYDTQDGLFSVAWSEINDSHLITGSGDGSVKLWDTNINNFPIRAWNEHRREVFCVDWSNLEKGLFASCSWDATIKIWSPERTQSINSIGAHKSSIYQVQWSPHTPGVLASCCVDGIIKIVDIRKPLPPPQLQSDAFLSINAGPGELLALDWNKYQPWIIASAGVNRSIQIWDCRMVNGQPIDVLEAAQPVGTLANELKGHEYAIRKLQWSPHRADLIASASYDMSCRVWTTAPRPPAVPALLYIHDQHTEFVVGCAWSLYEEGVLASCSWDHSLQVYRPLI